MDNVEEDLKSIGEEQGTVPNGRNLYRRPRSSLGNSDKEEEVNTTKCFLDKVDI